MTAMGNAPKHNMYDDVTHAYTTINNINKRERQMHSLSHVSIHVHTLAFYNVYYYYTTHYLPTYFFFLMQLHTHTRIKYIYATKQQQ